MKKGILFSLCVLQAFFSGCATIVHGGKQTVRVETNPPGATVAVSGRSMELVSPTDLVLRRNDDYEIKIEKNGYKNQFVILDRRISGWWLWGNLFSWGGLGMLVDMANGASHKLEPKEVHVTLKPQSKAFEREDEGEKV